MARSGKKTGEGAASADRPFFIFPAWADRFGATLFAVSMLGVAFASFVAVYYLAPQTLNVNYQPVQPVKYSHKQHAGDLGMDCRYCHNTVERAAHAAVPPTQTCMNCHEAMNPDSDQLLLVRESNATGLPVPWVRIHKLSEFAYFDHSAHVTRGIGCVSCHGRIDKMEVVYQEETLRMKFCTDCHRRPELHLRPMDTITAMDWTPPGGDQLALGMKLKKEYDIDPSLECSTCHR